MGKKGHVDPSFSRGLIREALTSQEDLILESGAGHSLQKGRPPPANFDGCEESLGKSTQSTIRIISVTGNGRGRRCKKNGV